MTLTAIGRYAILEEIGHGGMSVVYRGQDTSLEREVAVKVLHDHLARKPEHRKRLHREAKAIARLRHANIVEVYDYGAPDAERAYIVMEYVAGQNLRQFVATHGPMAPEHGALLGAILCEALREAHEHGIIHRDLKPENVMVSRAGDVKLMDFGIAHVFDAETMTQTGSLMGSPAHMAPEVIEGEDADARSDIFALGTILYWLVTGELPFDGKNAPQVLKRVMEGLYRNPESIDPRVGQCFGDIIRRAMSHDPAQRYEDAAALGHALREVAEQASPTRAPGALRAYLLDPAGERAALEGALTVELVARGEAALEAGNPAQAMRAFNRALAYEPSNEAVHAALRRLEQRRPSVALGLGALALCVICVGAGLTWQRVQAQADEARAQDARRAGAARVLSAREAASAQALAASRAPAPGPDLEAALVRLSARLAQAADAARQAVSVREAALRVDAARPVLTRVSRVSALQTQRLLQRARASAPDLGAPAPAPDAADMGADRAVAVAPERWPYRFKVLPGVAFLAIGDERVSAWNAQHRGVELPQGRHTVIATCNDCVARRLVVDVSGPQPQVQPVPVMLQWKSATIAVQSDVRATVWINGKPEGTLWPHRSVSIPVELGQGSNDPNRRLEVQVRPFDNTQRVFSREVQLRPGARVEVAATFQPSSP